MPPRPRMKLVAMRRTKAGNRAARRKRDNAGIVVNASARGSATTTIRGSAQKDLITSLPVFGNKKMENCKMAYYQRGFELKSSIGALQTWNFRANDAYDPDATGTGQQPAGFDETMASYEQFCVVSSKITVRFISNSTSVVICAIRLAPDTTPPATVQDWMISGQMKQGLVFGASSATAGGAKNTFLQLEHTCSNPRYFSQSRGGYFANPIFNGNVATSPAELVYYTVGAFCMNGDFDYSVVWDVQLSYDVKFWEPRPISISLRAESARNILEEDIIERSVAGEHQARAREIRAYLRRNSPGGKFHIREFCMALQREGYWQDPNTYRVRRLAEEQVKAQRKLRAAESEEKIDRHDRWPSDERKEVLINDSSHDYLSQPRMMDGGPYVYFYGGTHSAGRRHYVSDTQFRALQEQFPEKEDPLESLQQCKISVEPPELVLEPEKLPVSTSCQI